MRSIMQVVLCTILAAASACTAPMKTDKVADKRAALVPMENTGMHERNVELAARAKANPNAQLVFLGDSITQGWEEGGHDVWEREFATYAPLNLGVSGDRTEHVLWRFAQGDYDQLHPKVVVIMIGTNNTGHRMDPPADIAAGVKEILSQVKQRYPKAKLVMLSIFPRGEKPDDSMRKNNDAADVLIAAIAKDAGAEWLDLTRAFVDSRGILSKDLMPDLLHPNTRGYEIWANAIRGPLKHLLQ